MQYVTKLLNPLAVCVLKGCASVVEQSFVLKKLERINFNYKAAEHSSKIKIPDWFPFGCVCVHNSMQDQEQGSLLAPSHFKTGRHLKIIGKRHSEIPQRFPSS